MLIKLQRATPEWIFRLIKNTTGHLAVDFKGGQRIDEAGGLQTVSK